MHPCCSMLWGRITKFFTLGRQRKRVIPSGVLIGSAFPEIFPFSAELGAAQGRDIFSTAFRPEHARLFATRTNQCLATCFNHSRSDEVTFFAEGAILHPLHVTLKVMQCFFHRLLAA